MAMKVYVFIAALVVAFILFAYYTGVRDGKHRCNMQISEHSAQQQVHLIKLQEEINAESMHVATGDIRRILREKYTIAE